ncbi:MAG: acyltransferase [Candidatus Magasanikbacteria bacterium]|nr:acyltransferase [Candidatus Magasanikbacteria bacterium]
MFIRECVQRIIFWRNADRVGPDIPWTYWRLFFPKQMRRLCKKMFKAFGEGAEIRPGSYIVCCSRINIGRRVVVRPGSVFEADPRPGEQGIMIGDDVLLGPGVHIYVNNHDFDNPEVSTIDLPETPSKAVVVERGAWIGANAIILPGVVVGEHSVIGAGSVVTKSVPPYTIVAGNPARIIRALRQADAQATK